MSVTYTIEIPTNPENTIYNTVMKLFKVILNDGYYFVSCLTGSSSDDGGSNATSKNTFKKSRTSTTNETSRPPRPTYTARFKDGKYTVGVEASLFPGKEDNLVNNNNNDESIKNANGSCDAKQQQQQQQLDGKNVPSFHRSRDRTRISAVQRLVERKLAQKERERLRERELERDRLAHHLSGKARSSSSNSCYVRERSWDATYHSSCGFRSFSASGNVKEESSSELPKTRTEKENEYLASLLWRTSRSCSGTRRRAGDDEEEVAKTIITIGPGKPTRIREHSPSKKSPTSEFPPSSFGSSVTNNHEDSETEDDKPTPLKPVSQRDSSPSKKSESLYKNSSPLKSTGLFREFAKTTTTTTTKTEGREKRKTSFTTERTFQVNADQEAEKARRLSFDCNYVYERSKPTFSTFSQFEENQTAAPISSSTSSLASSFSSNSSADLTTEKEPIRLSRLRPATFSSPIPSPTTEKRTEAPAPEPPIRERKTSRRIFISSAFNNNNNNNTVNNNNKNEAYKNINIDIKNDSSADDTSSSVSNSSTDDSFTTGSDGAGSPFSSASSRLLFNLSSGYRFHRAAAAANSTGNTHHVNINISTSNKSYNSNDASYPRRRFSQQENISEERDTFSGESAFVTRPVRQPVRKISLPVRPMRESRREATRWDDSALFQSPNMSDKGEGSCYNSINSLGDGLSTMSASATATLWSKYKLCDDSLYYPGCCVEHDRLSLGEKSTTISSPMSAESFSNYVTNNDNISMYGDGANVEANLHVLEYCNVNDNQTDDSSIFSSSVFASTEMTEESYCSGSVSEIAEILSSSDGTVHDPDEFWCSKTPTKPTDFDNMKCLPPNVATLHLTNSTIDTNFEDEMESQYFTCDDDDQSLSTISGSGIDFFRKLVQRKDQFEEEQRPYSAGTVVEGGELLDRFINDSLQNNLVSPLQDAGPDFKVSDCREVSPCGTEEETEIKTPSSKSQSTVSGSGLFYLRNYLRKKSSPGVSNSTNDDEIEKDSRPESRQSSVGSTLADLLNETFDSEDSELQKLDWNEFEEDQDQDLTESYDITEDNISIGNIDEHYSMLQSLGSEKERSVDISENDDSSEICQIARDAASFKSEKRTQVEIKIEMAESPMSNCSTAKNSPSIQNLNPNDFVSLVHGFNKLNLVTRKEREALIQSMKETEPVKKLILSSPTTFNPKKKEEPIQQIQEQIEPSSSKNRLANFWEKRILQANPTENISSEGSENKDESISFRPAMPSYYNPETQSSANERIKLFLEVTRQAAESATASSQTVTASSQTTSHRVRTVSDNDDSLTSRHFGMRQIRKRLSVISVSSSLE